jgi:hypothetical protein
MIKYYNDDPNFGWKLHLRLKNEVGAEYKIGRNSGQTGKDATIYCGSKKNAKYIAGLTNTYIGRYLSEPTGDVLNDDIFFTDKVVGRFTTGRGYSSSSMINKSFDNEFHQYGGLGIPFLNKHMSEISFGDGKKDIEGWRKKSFEESDKLLKGDFREYYTGRRKKTIKPKQKRCRCKK